MARRAAPRRREKSVFFFLAAKNFGNTLILLTIFPVRITEDSTEKVRDARRETKPKKTLSILFRATARKDVPRSKAKLARVPALATKRKNPKNSGIAPSRPTRPHAEKIVMMAASIADLVVSFLRSDFLKNFSMLESFQNRPWKSSDFRNRNTPFKNQSKSYQNIFWRTMLMTVLD